MSKYHHQEDLDIAIEYVKDSGWEIKMIIKALLRLFKTKVTFFQKIKEDFQKIIITSSICRRLSESAFLPGAERA